MKTSIIFFAVCVFITSCSTNPPSPQNLKKTIMDVAKTNEKHIKRLEGISGEIDQSAVVIQEETDKINKQLPEESVTIIKPNLGTIHEEASDIRINVTEAMNLAHDLSITKDELSKASEEIAILQKNLETAHNDIKKLKDSNSAILRRAMLYLILAATAIIGISVTLFFYGNVKAIGGAIAGMVIIVVALAISYFSMYFALVGFVAIIVIIGVLAHQICSNKKIAETTKKALEQTVLTTEIAKQKLPEKERKEVFGDRAIPGFVANIQSEATEKLVMDIRKDLKDKIEPIIAPQTGSVS